MDVKSRIQKYNEFARLKCCKISAFSQFNKPALTAWSFRVILNSDGKPRSVHLPVPVLGRESKGLYHYYIITVSLINASLYDKQSQITV